MFAQLPLFVSLALLGLVIIQGAGAFTVTLKLLPNTDTAFDGWTDHCFDADVPVSSA